MKKINRYLKAFSVGLIFALILSACDAPSLGKKNNEFSVAGAEDTKEVSSEVKNGDQSDTGVGNDASDGGDGQTIADGTLGDDSIEDTETVMFPAGYFESDVNSTTTSFDTGKMEDWQKAFYDKLMSVQGETLQEIADSSYTVPSVGYFVYDADDDNTPELFIRYGTCEADYFMKIYKFEGGQAVEASAGFCGHTSFYSMPETGYISVWGHMGYFGAAKVHLNGHEVSSESVFEHDYNQDQNGDYPAVKDLVSGAEPLTEVKTNVFLPLIIYNHVPSTSDGLSDEDVKSKSEGIINNGGNVFCVTGDNYSETKGNVDFNTYLTKGYASDFYNYKVVGYDYHDLNSDGQKECVIKVKNQDNETSDGSTIVLSFQNGTTYAYSLNYVTNKLSFNDDGSFVDNAEYGSGYRFYFYKDQAYLNYYEK